MLVPLLLFQVVFQVMMVVQVAEVVEDIMLVQTMILKDQVIHLQLVHLKVILVGLVVVHQTKEVVEVVVQLPQVEIEVQL